MYERRREILLTLCLSVVVAIPFLPALHAGFTSWDDEINVTKNLYIQKGFSNGLLPLIRHSYEGLYVPVTYATYWVEFHLWGENAFAFHLANLFLHASNAALIYLIFRRLLPEKLPAAIAALWWGVHPLHAEPVAWVTGLKDVLSLTLTLISLRLYMACREKSPASNKHHAAWLWAASLFAFALACFSKPGVAAFPLVLAAYNVFVRKERALRAASLYFAISALTIVVTMLTQKSPVGYFPKLNLIQRMEVVGDSFLFYLQKLAWPSGLCAVYGRTYRGTFAQWPWVPLLVTGAVCAVAMIPGRQWRMGTTIFLAGFAPISGIVPFAYQRYSTVADRYAYFAAIGVALILGDVVSRFTPPQAKQNKKGIVVASCVILWSLLLGIASWNQTRTWHDSFTLWQRVIEVVPDSAEGYNNRGVAYCSNGDYDQAIADCTHALQLKPSYADAYNNRGAAYMEKEDYDPAIEDFTHAIRLRTDYAMAYHNRGVAWARKKQYAQAIEDYTHAIKFRRNFADAYNNLAKAWLSKGDCSRAIENCTRAIEINPRLTDAYYSRSVAYYFLKNYDAAWADVHRCSKLGESVNPDFIERLRRDSARSE